MTGRFGEVTLHDEIAAILRGVGNAGMVTGDIAGEVNRRGRYQKGDGSLVATSQIAARINRCPELFERDGARVRLRGTTTTKGIEPPTQPVARSEPVRPVVTSTTRLTQPTEVSLVEVLACLARGRALEPSRAGASVPASPGLYAVHGPAEVWMELGLGKPPNDRPLYVGKSESSLLGRDIGQHFGTGQTGSSTLRRSIAALLSDRLDLRGVPRNLAKPERFANYGLLPEADGRLTAWMRGNLRLAVWPSPPGTSLAGLERRVLQQVLPPLNVQNVVTPWTSRVKAARAVMAEQARTSGY